MLKIRKSFVAATLLLLVAAVAWAQLPPAAAEALEQARTAAEQALVLGERTYPDAPHWAEAIRRGRLALELAPNDPQVLRFLAETTTTTRWYAPAWQYWQAYAAAFPLDGAALEAGTAVGNQQAYLRYAQRDLADALDCYREVIAFNPGDATAYRWAGRILLEQGRPEDALPYWREAVRLDPLDAGSAYFLQLAQDEIRFGIRGTEAFYAGIRAYEAGDLERAFERFRQAALANPAYKDAFVWAGRTSLELGQPQVAAGYWHRVLQLDPADERAAYFLALAQDQLHWGVAAATHSYEGVRCYELDDLVLARSEFLLATQANPRYPEAWAWLGRTEFEQANYPLAAQAYGMASELAPDNEAYDYFHREALRLTQ